MARLGRLTVLRLTFLALGGLLLVPLYMLKGAVDSRIAAQARLRHEVVAERIFDEFERELTRVIERETARPSSAYDSPTDPASWAPFIVGYYTVTEQGARFTPRDAAGVNSQVSIQTHLNEMRAGPPKQLIVPEQRSSANQERTKSAVPSSAKALPSRSSPEVLRQLNLGSEQRKPAAKSAKKTKSDPLQDYAY